ncbi:TonB-dependent receptor domain-containing protein [Lacibacter sp.]|uniref:TonB-dependent receptor domain-containing protein n=1 Tax=Lacibacter sp. TaxID=1915409 RepID=UPI002B4B2200|nr:TonB-dependent receptor [Lacibacter sp.]HLP37688.1 TonB-dependent receptor [Lacibacter sp.]
MKSLLIFVNCLLIAGTAPAQQIDLSGKVVDSLEQRPLKGASITLYDANGQKIQRLLTDSTGNFKTKTDSLLAKSASISFSGYKEKKILFSYDGLLKQYKLGTLYLYPEASSLTEVVVKGARPPVSFKIDRQVYKPSQFANAANGNGVDVIRNLPSMSVNGQGEISFRGSASFLVLINGKPTQGDPAFVLSQLAAGSIENIEIITSPSAVYDADGKSGIINIITKTGAEDGWMLQTNVMGGVPALNDFNNRRYTNPQRFSVDVSASYRKNKWDASGGFNYLRNDMAGFREGDVYTIINNIKTSFPSTGERSFSRYNYGARLALSYQPNQSNTISTGFYIGKRFQSRVADLLYNNSKTDLSNNSSTAFTYFNQNTQEKEGVFTLANLDYTHMFADKSKLSFSGLFERADLTGNTYNNNLRYPFIADTIQYTWNPTTNPLNAYRIKADYSKSIGRATFQAGYQFRYDEQNGNFVYLTKVLGTANFVTDPAFTSRVDVTNHIHAAYLQYGSSYKKLDYSAGLRLEESVRNLSFSQANAKSRLSLTNLFPSVQFRYKSWNRGVLKAGYSRRIKRTNNYELNPFPEREHSETLEQGDPDLLPEFIGNYEVGAEQTFSKGNFFVTLYHQRIANPIQRVNKIFNDTILNRVFTNAGRATQTGFETNITLQVTKWWQFIAGGNIYKYQIKGNIFNGTIAISNNSWVYSINSTQSFTLPDNWIMQLSINYLSLRATAQGEDSRFVTPHFTVKKTTKDQRWYAQFQWLYMDGGLKFSNRQRITTSGTNFFTTTNYIYEPDQLQFSIGFNLARKNRKINLPVSEMGEKEF